MQCILLLLNWPIRRCDAYSIEMDANKIVTVMTVGELSWVKNLQFPDICLVHVTGFRIICIIYCIECIISVQKALASNRSNELQNSFVLYYSVKSLNGAYKIQSTF